MIENEEKIVRPDFKLPSDFKDTTLVFYGQLDEKIFESAQEKARKRVFSII